MEADEAHGWLTGWCASIASKVDPRSTEEATGQGAWETGNICGKVQRVMQSQLCGGDTLELVKRASGQTLKGGKRGRAQKISDKDYFDREKDLILDLPPLQESYRLIKTQSLGILKLAIHQESHQRRAVFTLPKRSIVQAIPPGSDDRKEVLEHLQKILKVDHVNVLALHEACEDARCVHLIYDWPEGGLLLSHLTQYHSDVTEAHVASVIRETLAGVAAAARFNVYHHDWSLMCLFLGYKNRFSPIKVFGVGLAGYLVPLVTARRTSRANKYFYASPELLEENYKNMTHKKLLSCDVWSVGTLLYMLFSGRPPFHGNYEEAVARIKQRHWSFGPEFDRVSKEAKDIIYKMLTRDWERRPSASDLLKHPFLGLEIGKKKQGSVVCQDALSKLDAFARETHCKQTLARLLADIGLQESVYSDLEDKFKQLDLDNNGVVEVAELEELGGQLNLPGIDGATVASIIAACDRNANGTIDISEFVSALVLQLENKDERLLVMAFEKMDKNGDARITKGEIFRVLRQYSGSLEAADVSNFVADTDKDTDQKVDYNEFKMLFPHIKEKDEEVRTRLRNAHVDKESLRKGWGVILASFDKFLRSLRSCAGRLALEHATMQKVGGNEKVISERILELEKVFLSHILHKTEEDLAAKSDPKHQQKMLQGLTGLNVMNLFNVHDEEEGAHGGHADPERSPTHARGHHAGDADEGGTHGRARPLRQATAISQADQGDGEGGKGNIASRYTRRSLCSNLSPEEFQREVQRRRRYLWLGAGEGIRHVRAHIYRKEIKPTPVPPPRADGKPPVSDRSEMSEGSVGDSPRSPELARVSSFVKATPSEEQTAAASGSALAILRRAGVEEEAVKDVGEPWTTKWKYLRSAHTAMQIAEGRPEAKIGSLSPEDQRIRLKEIARNHFDTFGYRGSEDLSDLHRLLKYKALRSWLPPIELLQQELIRSRDESKVHVMERRSCHLGGIRFLLQLVERVMFSLCELIVWQEEGMAAAWMIEEVSPPSAATRRFLPPRQGEVDENARTPRDEEDAEELAPDEQSSGDEAGLGRQGTAVSFAEGEASASHMDLSANDIGVANSTRHHGSGHRLDRTAVRAGRPISPSKGAGKGMDTRPSRTGRATAPDAAGG